MPQPFEHQEQAEHKAEQAFIDAYSESRTIQLQNLFPVTSKTITSKDGLHRHHESLNICNHKKIKALRWVENLIDTSKGFVEDGKIREWQCQDCKMNLAESLLLRLYPQIKFDQPEINLPEEFHVE